MLPLTVVDRESISIALVLLRCIVVVEQHAKIDHFFEPIFLTMAVL